MKNANGCEVKPETDSPESLQAATSLAGLAIAAPDPRRLAIISRLFQGISDAVLEIVDEATGTTSSGSYDFGDMPEQWRSEAVGALKRIETALRSRPATISRGYPKAAGEGYTFTAEFRCSATGISITELTFKIDGHEDHPRWKISGGYIYSGPLFNRIAGLTNEAAGG